MGAAIPQASHLADSDRKTIGMLKVASALARRSQATFAAVGAMMKLRCRAANPDKGVKTHKTAIVLNRNSEGVWTVFRNARKDQIDVPVHVSLKPAGSTQLRSVTELTLYSVLTVSAFCRMLNHSRTRLLLKGAGDEYHSTLFTILVRLHMGSLVDRIYRFVTVPPSLADPEEMRVARLLQKIIPMLAVSASINFLGSLIVGANFDRYFWIFVATVLLCVFGLLILRRGKARQAARSVITLGWVFTLIFCFTGGGLRAPIFLLYAVITYAAGILLGKQALWKTTILTMLTVLALAVLEGNDLLPASTIVLSPASLFFNYTALLVLVWSLQHILTNSLSEALQQSHEELSSRTKAEQSLVENERRLRQIIDLVPHFIFAKDENGKFILVNKAVADAYGTTVEELTGKTDADFANSEEELRHFREDDLAVINSGMAKLIPVETITDASGRVRLLSTQKIPFAVSDASFRALIGISVDITDREQAQQAIRAREEQYRQLFEMESDALLLIENESGNILEANNAACVLYGYSHAELLSLNNCDLSAEPEKTRLVTTETPISPEHLLTIPLRLHRKKGGTVFPVEVTARFFLRDGKPVHIASNRDITQREASEELLRRAQSMLAQILDSVPQSVFWKDREGRFLGCNKQFALAAGFESPSQIIGKTDFEITATSELAETYRTDDRDVLDGGQTKQHIVEQSSRGNGNVRWLETTKIPLRGEDGQTYGVLGVFEDITERRQGVEILEQERNLLRTLIDTLPSSVYIYIKDSECRYVINNLAHLKSMGLSSQEEAVGKTSLDFYPSEYATMFIEDEREVIRTGEGIINKEEMSMSRSGDGVRWHLTTKIPLRDSSGKIVGLVGMSSDITERKRIEEALRESEERFRSLYDNATIGLYRTTPDGRIIISNPAVLRMLGYDSLEDLTKRNLEDKEFDPTYNRAEFRERLERDRKSVV
jgi:PAS domain S-box-containing protein